MALLGVDYYGGETKVPPDFNKAKAGGIRFAICRAVYGRPVTKGSKKPYLDPAWQRDEQRILESGLIRGAYLFVCYPRKGYYTPEPEEQAEAFIEYVQLTAHDFVPQFDVEEASDILTAQQMYDWTLRVATALAKHYGAMPGMYTSNRVWTENLKSHSAGALLACPLWLAKPWPWPPRSPAHMTGMPASPTYIPQWGNQWWIYQYQGDALRVPGFSSTSDLNSFNLIVKGSQGDTVKWAQRRLGAGLVIDGIFGANTEAATKAFQVSVGLVADGQIGPATQACLSWIAPC